MGQLALEHPLIFPWSPPPSGLGEHSQHRHPTAYEVTDERSTLGFRLPWEIRPNAASSKHHQKDDEQDGGKEPDADAGQQSDLLPAQPGDRRFAPYTRRPAWSGVSLARRVVRKSRRSVLAVTSFTVRAHAARGRLCEYPSQQGRLRVSRVPFP